MSCPGDEITALVADGDEGFARHRAGCVTCRREAEAIERTLRALGPLASARPAGDASSASNDQFVAAVRRGYEESVARRARGRWRLPAITLALAAAAALVALLQPRVVVPHAAPAHVEHAAGDDDDDPCELIGELDADELLTVQSKYGNGA
jgi:hypothetical protein